MRMRSASGSIGIAGAIAGILLSLPTVLFAQETPAAREILATVDGQAITAAEIEKSIKGQMLRINNQVYSVKKKSR
jgi:hypothetical protein